MEPRPRLLEGEPGLQTLLRGDVSRTCVVTSNLAPSAKLPALVISAGVKDSGTFFPGIGGILDLLDSLLFNAPIMYLYLRHVLSHGL